VANNNDRFDSDNASGGGFLIGLLTGTVLGAGLGILFAPKAGSELRDQLSEQAGTLANSASDNYRRATETASEWADRTRGAVEKAADRGREMYDKAADKGRDILDKTKSAVAEGTEEAQRYAKDAAGDIQRG